MASHDESGLDIGSVLNIVCLYVWISGGKKTSTANTVHALETAKMAGN